MVPPEHPGFCLSWKIKQVGHIAQAQAPEVQGHKDKNNFSGLNSTFQKKLKRWVEVVCTILCLLTWKNCMLQEKNDLKGIWLN